jgi:hypothetical protein
MAYINGIDSNIIKQERYIVSIRMRPNLIEMTEDNLITNTSNEAESPACLVGAVIGSACSRHKSKQLGYLQWHDWAEKKTKRGAKQKQCTKLKNNQL